MRRPLFLPFFLPFFLPLFLPFFGLAAFSGCLPGGWQDLTSAGGPEWSVACPEKVACQLAPLPSTGDPRQDCVDRINQFRVECACLPPLERWPEGEACADQHAQYDSTRVPHSGFTDGICPSGGFAQNECPGWPSVDRVVGRCLQQMWDEGPPPADPCTGDCFETYGHFINMTSPRAGRVACGFFQTAAGEFWATQNFTR